MSFSSLITLFEQYIPDQRVGRTTLGIRVLSPTFVVDYTNLSTKNLKVSGDNNSYLQNSYSLTLFFFSIFLKEDELVGVRLIDPPWHVQRVEI